VPVGLNLGANKDSTDRAEDFARVLAHCGPHVDFATVNVSSPNTERLRDLQGPVALRALLDGVMEARAGLARPVPVFLKIAPDLPDDELAGVAEVALAAGIDAIVATNTTLSRDGLKSRHAGEKGGLSGVPLFERSTRVLARLSQLTEGRMPLVGCGRHRQRRDGLCQDQGRGHGGAALQRAGLWRAVAGAADRAGAGCRAGPRRACPGGRCRGHGPGRLAVTPAEPTLTGRR
jgi:dihydroorotate dehydrogenase